MASTGAEAHAWPSLPQSLLLLGAFTPSLSFRILRTPSWRSRGSLGMWNPKRDLCNFARCSIFALAAPLIVETLTEARTADWRGFALTQPAQRCRVLLCSVIDSVSWCPDCVFSSMGLLYHSQGIRGSRVFTTKEDIVACWQEFGLAHGKARCFQISCATGQRLGSLVGGVGQMPLVPVPNTGVARAGEIRNVQVDCGGVDAHVIKLLITHA